MVKIQIKSDETTPFGGIFSIIDRFDAQISPIIDSILGLHSKYIGYQYSEIIRSLMCVFLRRLMCGGCFKSSQVSPLLASPASYKKRPIY